MGIGNSATFAGVDIGNSATFAGVDIGNSTTEVVLVDGSSGRVLGADRVPTRGLKGGTASLDGAARLVRRLVAASGGSLDAAAVAPLRPVVTTTATLPEPVVDTGRLRVVAAGASTTGGSGSGVGRPFPVGWARPDGPVGRARPDGTVGWARPDGPVVALVPAASGYRSVIDELRELAARGVLAGVVAERDEAVLLANRLPAGIPVVDEVPVVGLAKALLIAVEVRSPLRSLVDPLWMVSRLGLSAAEHGDAARVASLLYDRSSAVVALSAAAGRAESAPAATMTLTDGSSHELSPAFLAAHPPGLVTSYRLPDGSAQPVDDLFAVDLAVLADRQLLRGDAISSQTVALAALHADAPYTDPGPALSALLGVPVHTAAGEAAAARLGALSTPGAPAGAVVVDLGGGTIDVVSPAGATVLAGAGELLTAATAAMLGVARTPAEWAKRGPAFRVEAPQLLLAEDGGRTFLDAPVRPDAMGALVVTGPAGWLPFGRRLAPGEWRALRLRLKTEILGGNLARALPAAPGTVLVVGGPAGDDEVLGCVARAMPPGTAVSRADTAGVLGHRHAVAYGLVLSALTWAQR
jgi:hypothetical protein